MSKQHDRLQRVTIKENVLQVGGRSAAQLVEIAGGTPCYVYDRNALTGRVQSLRAAMPSELKLHYAIKANPMPAVVHHMAGLLDGLDVASQKEMMVAIGSGVNPEMISFAGPAKRLEELRAAVAANIVINVESRLELERLYQLSSEMGIKPRVAFRVNPDFELKSSGMKMAGGPKQFGIDAEQMPEVLFALDTGKVDFCGFHIFSGSQNLNPEALIEAHDKTFELAARLSELAPAPVKHVNIGGGLGIPYFPGETQLDIEPIAENLRKRMDARTGSFKDSEIVMELGRYLVGEAGYYFCRVTDKKQSRGQTFLMTDGGLHHHLSNSGNFGQVIRKNYPVLIANRVDGEDKERVEIVGPLCTPLDIVGAKLELPVADVGDLVVVFQSGAYGATASPQDFLSHPHVRELLV
ncbi:pyridoxal-dependent decarboxylase, exosortase A system-associated [Endozoicomonas arenosclerae]|uniref:pyridoxal-dependent decarboxylase, exosortase A system-associated n=1 Tax=Endozoicomonas arenosclerae TaxID=1633495 RepID=UPI0007831EC0|nr:pyridoxal-dependent decarboxylase, exosortase A system-associated [Endozoicomonas arenosclerae]